MKVLIASVSSRADALSAVAAGYEVISLDFFGDSDYPEPVEVYSLARDFHCLPDLKGLAWAIEVLAERADAVVIGAGLENEPALVEVPVKGKRWYNSADAIRGIRDLGRVQGALHDLPIEIPQSVHSNDSLPQKGRWLMKDMRRSGGMGVQDWDGSSRLVPGQVLVEYVPGVLASATFIADGKHARLLGISRQYAGVKELNGPGYAWCGNVVPWGDAGLIELFAQVVDRLAESFGLVGVNGIDFILHEGVPYLIEGNPRPCGSGELFERLLRMNLFQLHVDGCEGRLPDLVPAAPTGVCWGKGILYASQDLVLGDTSDWAQRGIADVPHPGESIPAGAPVCSILARGKDPEACWSEVLAFSGSFACELVKE